MTLESRPRPVREASELGDMMRRMLRALARRATDGDLFALEELAGLRNALDVAVKLAARGAHEGPAQYSWTDISRELGITRQAAWKLYGRPGDDGGE